MANSGKRLLLIENSICSDEVRVALSADNRVVEFEQEFKEKKQLRGNIYIACVKRVEPSLQAVFIEYGKNKQGFLSFSEISPDYFNIPEKEKETFFEGCLNDDCTEENGNASANISSDSLTNKNVNESGNGFVREVSLYKRYKLQDVISVNQRLLVQLTKEERGNKGASFTTYITLVGRYCVFMPNSMSKGGVSRRIEDVNVRKQLKDILSSMDLPKRSGLIIRTIGSGKSKKEIEQDYNYLSSLWQNIQKNASSINVPSLIYNEADLIMRSIRDFCSNGMEVIVSGKEAFETVRQYARNALKGSKLRYRLYRGFIPIFTYYGVEDQISELYSNRVKLPSGGSLIITLTEAFVSIDVNSGKMTGEDSIEETAYRTNMEAVPEISRQVNLRGLSGLIVVDFIDMLRYQYCRAVESAIRQAFKDDKARVQFSYINDFGLMVFSRQRIKPSIQEINTTECLHCKGIGKVKSNEVIVASILRDLQHIASRNRNRSFDLVAHGAIIAHIFNNKRGTVSTIEKEFNIKLNVSADSSLSVDTFVLKRGDEVNLSDCKPLQNSGYKIESSSNERADNSEKLQGSFWLTKWLSRILNSNS
ncbi:Rne/Rng family ribonuclease [Wolbachia endosymbiont of Brugia malayi]|uniref:Rne/Rng family ribonuclease n=1 Tax=Wolbachia endosymbiont of Brugia malayi TaxID=80849 RepID=UPI00004C93FC|nr:Rne/Rng family ribonuclease [Wolbachia endosymbiont of Brugia malayi]AAW71084.1 Ribonucleases G and E [Wolbachia endosymbiont strain TRS of Brugia malayi]QCB62028.1 Rne/Rng family ribonuclease [Wolbachia endosymbiont of Brugia malayi]